MIKISSFNNSYFSEFDLFIYLKKYKYVFLSGDRQFIIVVIDDRRDSFTIAIDQHSNHIRGQSTDFFLDFNNYLLRHKFARVFIKPFSKQNLTFIESLFKIYDYHITLERPSSPFFKQNQANTIVDSNLKELSITEFPYSLDAFFNTIFVDEYPFNLNEYKELFLNKRQIILCLEHKEDIIGALMGYFTSNDKFYLCLLGVKETYRNLGIASYLIDELIHRCFDTTIFLGVYKSNYKAYNFYLKRCFSYKKTNLLVIQVPLRL